VRIFYDGLVGTGVAASYFPVGAQWDNVAVTKASSFVPPQASNSTATLRPIVRITNPTHNSTVAVTNSSSSLAMAVDATDLDGSVTNVQFFAGTNKVANANSTPWSGTWSNVASGNYVLTALATDNTGATTLSAPVYLSITVFPPPDALPRLQIAPAGSNVLLSWLSNTIPLVVQAARTWAPSSFGKRRPTYHSDKRHEHRDAPRHQVEGIFPARWRG